MTESSSGPVGTSFAASDRGKNGKAASNAWWRDATALELFSLLLVALTFATGLTREFFWDDDYLIRAAKGLSTLLDAFRFDSFGLPSNEGRVSYYRPLATLSFALEVRAWGPNALVSHSSNLLLHVINTRLAFLFLKRHLGENARSTALLLATLWAVFPIHAEVVSWISARGDLLGNFFLLSGTAAIARTRQWWTAALAACAFGAAAILSKEAYIVAPLFFAAEVARSGGPSVGRRALIVAGTAMLPATGYAFFRLLGPGLGGGQGIVVAALPLVDRVILVFETIGYTVATIVVPFRPELLRGSLGYVDPLGLQSEPLWGGLGLTAALLVSVLFLKLRALRLSLALLTLSVLPFLNLVPTGMESRMSDRYAYLPSLLVLLAVGTALEMPLRGRIGKLALLGSILLGIALTPPRAAAFGTPIKLVNEELRVNRPPHSVFTIAAHIYSEEGDLLRARDTFLDALNRQNELGMPPFFRDALSAALLQIRINGQQLPQERARGKELIQCLLTAQDRTVSMPMTLGKGGLSFPCAAPEIQQQIEPRRPLLEATMLLFKAEDGKLSREELIAADATCPTCTSQKKVLALAALALPAPDLVAPLLEGEITAGKTSFASEARVAATYQTALLKKKERLAELRAWFVGGAFLRVCGAASGSPDEEGLIRASCALGGQRETSELQFASPQSIRLRTSPLERTRWLEKVPFSK